MAQNNLRLLVDNTRGLLLSNTRLLHYLMLLVSGFCLFSHLGVQFADYMETRNFVTAREALELNHWFLPTMNGNLRLEKPPLPTWLTALAMYLWGQDNLFVLRFPAALAGLLLIQYVYLFCKQISENKWFPFVASITVVTSFYVAFQARTGTWDIFCHAFMMGAIVHLHKALEKNKQFIFDFLIAGLLMGLSGLSKGPVAFYALLFPFLIAYFLRNPKGKLKGKIGFFFLTFLLAVAISLSWSILLFFYHPNELSQVALQESKAWVSHNIRPFYHYWWFAAQSGIWTIGAIFAMCFGYASRRINKVTDYWFLFAWVIAGVVLLSILPEKKERYLFPVLVPLGMLTGSLFCAIQNEGVLSKKSSLFLTIQNVLFASLSVIIPIFFIIGRFVLNKPFTNVALANAILFGSLFLFLFRYAYQKRKGLLTWASTAAFFSAAVVLFLPSLVGVMTKHEYKPMNQLRSNIEYRTYPVYYHGDFLRMELVWEGGKQIKTFHPDLLTSGEPFILISNKPADETLATFTSKPITAQSLGTFNSSWNGRNKHLFENSVSLITVPTN